MDVAVSKVYKTETLANQERHKGIRQTSWKTLSRYSASSTRVGQARYSPDVQCPRAWLRNVENTRPYTRIGGFPRLVLLANHKLIMGKYRRGFCPARLGPGALPLLNFINKTRQLEFEEWERFPTSSRAQLHMRNGGRCTLGFAMLPVEICLNKPRRIIIGNEMHAAWRICRK